jgi:hypothetical protein
MIVYIMFEYLVTSFQFKGPIGKRGGVERHRIFFVLCINVIFLRPILGKGGGQPTSV